MSKVENKTKARVYFVAGTHRWNKSQNIGCLLVFLTFKFRQTVRAARTYSLIVTDKLKTKCYLLIISFHFSKFVL